MSDGGPSAFKRLRSLAGRRLPWLAETVRTVRPAMRRRRASLRGLDRQAVFTRIYEQGLWGTTETASGRGSTLRATEAIRAELPGLLERLGVRTLFDAPCGDFNWMNATPLGLDRYIGGDIVEDLVAELTAAHGSTSREFILIDVVRDPLPAADAMLCRDCLIHLPLGDASTALDNVLASPIRWLLTNTYPQTRINRDIETGASRPLNLELPPFSLPPPDSIIDERSTEGHRKLLGVWDLDALRRDRRVTA